MATSNEDVNIIIDRRNESRKRFKANYYDEIVEVFRAIKVKTKPIMKRDASGRETKKEDKTQTNVAMPEVNLAWRRNKARMTAQPYNLKYTGAADPMVNEMLSALSAQQYDRSKECFHDRRIVGMAEAFGFAYSKLYWDTLTRTMQFRRALTKGNDILMRDRASVMRYMGAPEDEINAAVQQNGSELSDKEVANFTAKNGNEIVVPQEITKYEGPCVKSIWIGDLFLPPDVLCLDDSDWLVEQYQETKLWLARMSKLEYRDPDSGQMVKAFEPAMIQKLIDADPESDKRDDDLKQYLHNSIGKQGESDDPLPKRLRGQKRYDILEQHMIDDDGRVWITWVAEKMREGYLGRMPYPVDLYGDFFYTDLVPLPDMLGAIGDSTPRLMRFLHQMHNRTVAQNFDYVTNSLKPTIMEKSGSRIETDIIDRGRFRIVKCSDPNGYSVFPEPPLPAGAFEREAGVLRMEAMLEPSLNTVDTGTASNPMAGKLATTAILNAKASDALTQDKLDARNWYLKRMGQKKLWMNQQMASEPWRIESDFYTDDLSKKVKGFDGVEKAQLPQWALSDRNGKVVAIRLDPLEIQEDIHVEPEAGSYLSVDDEIRQNAAMQVQAVATANPGIIDQRKVARFQLSTIKGIGNPDDYIIPDQGQQPPETRVNVSVAVKWTDLPADVQAQLLTSANIQFNPQDFAVKGTLDAVKQTSEAADAAANLMSPAQPEPKPVPAHA